FPDHGIDVEAGPGLEDLSDMRGDRRDRTNGTTDVGLPDEHGVAACADALAAACSQRQTRYLRELEQSQTADEIGTCRPLVCDDGDYVDITAARAVAADAERASAGAGDHASGQQAISGSKIGPGGSSGVRGQRRWHGTSLRRRSASV